MKSIDKATVKGEKLNWFAKLLKPVKKLENVLAEFRAQKALLNEKKQCYLYFLQQELASLKDQIETKFIDENILCLNVPVAFGIQSFIQETAQNWEAKNNQLSFYFRLTPGLKDANQLALIFLKEHGHKVTNEPLIQLKNYLAGKKVLIILEDILHLSAAQLDLLLVSLEAVKVILINEGIIQAACLKGRVYSNINIMPPTSEKAAELALTLLNYRADLIMTSAERHELLSLINLCGNLPAIIFMALAAPQSNSNLSIDKYVKEIAKHRSQEQPVYFAVLTFLLERFPEEILYVLQKSYYLPASGFTLNDLYVICRPRFNSKDLVPILDFLVQQSWLSSDLAGDLVIYQMPSFIKKFIKDNLLDPLADEENQINKLLIQRLESNLLWKEDRIWISQLEQTLISLDWIARSKQFDKNRYFILYIQSILMELGLWTNVENTLVPFCEAAIKDSDNNEDRGFWYSLLGLMYRGIAKFKEPQKQLDKSLLAFQKSLKFYDPQKQQKRYSFVYQNIGLVYSELYRRDRNESHLKQAIKAYYKAIGDDKRKEESSIITLRRLLAQSYFELSQLEKPLENFQKSYTMYKLALDGLDKNPEDPRIKVIGRELEKLLKQINSALTKCGSSDKLALIMLKKQLEDLVGKKNKPKIKSAAS
jgi:hypothetical protein